MAAPRIALRTSMQLEGLEELHDMLTDVAPREANNILRASVHGLAGKVRDAMKINVVKDTRALEKSIYAVRRRGKPNFPVSEVRLRGTPHAHGIMVEFGTRRTRAQPYIVPTVEQIRPRVPQEYRETFGQKLEKALARRAKKAAA